MGFVIHKNKTELQKDHPNGAVNFFFFFKERHLSINSTNREPQILPKALIGGQKFMFSVDLSREVVADCLSC